MPRAVWPYEDLLIHPRGEQKVLLAAPWFSREISFVPETKAFFETLFSRPDQLTLDQQRASWKRVFSEYPHDPLFYVLPLPADAQTGTDSHELADGMETQREMSERFLAEHGLRDSALGKRVLSRDWDMKAILELCRVPGSELYDPSSLFSALRRFYYLDAQDFDRTSEMYEHVLKLSPDRKKFRAAAFLIARQNYEVTLRCQESLLPAISLAQSREGLLKEFIDSERGHDLLLKRGLLMLAEGQELPAPCALTTLLMDSFRLCAQRNFLAFALTVSLFEESSPDGGMDPLTRLLLQGGEESAAEGFRRHGQINDGGHHDHIGMDLIAGMAPVSRSYAEETVALVEGVSKALNSLTTEILEKIKR